MNYNASWITARRGARIIPRVSRLCPGDEQSTSTSLFLSDYINPTTLWVVDNFSPLIPVNETGRLRGLENDAS